MIHTIHHFFEACHPFGYPLLACSIALLAAIFYHGFFVGCRRRKALRILQQSLQQGRAADLTSLPNLCPGELAAIIAAAAGSAQRTTTEARLVQLIDSWRSGLALISIITNIAPMLGILGTAWGLVDIFGVFGTPDAQVGIALGISKALYTTIFGLAIAVPGMVALTCFERRLERRAADINTLMTELLDHSASK